MNTENTATLVAVDTETGGAGETQCTTHALLSIGCAAYDAQGYLHTFHQLVLPEPRLKIHPEAVAVNGYDRDKWMKLGAAVESWACIRLLNWIIMRFNQGGKVKLTGLSHNAGHDKGFIEAMLTRQGWRREWEETVSRRWRCSCAALGFLQDAGLLPAAGGASLDNLTALRTGDTIDNVRAARGIHTADHDALQCLDGYRWLMTLAATPTAH